MLKFGECLHICTFKRRDGPVPVILIRSDAV